MENNVTNKNLEDSSVKPPEKEKEWFQIIAIFICSLSSFTLGALFAWTSPAIPKITSDKVNYDINLEEASYFTVLPALGSLFFSLLFPPLLDRIGRKKIALFCAFPHILSLSLNAYASSVYVFYAARFISGLADAAVFSAVPVYVAEVATPRVRGTWGNMMTVFIYFGQFGVNAICSYTTIPVGSEILLIFPVTFFILFAFMPETPYYYLIKNRTKDAENSLRRLRRKNDVSVELEQLKLDVARQMSESGSWRDLFMIESNRKALYAAVFLRTSQQLGGLSVMHAYNQYIFEKAGSDISPPVAAMIFSISYTTANTLFVFLLEKAGRRISYCLSSLFCGLILLVLSVYFLVEQYWPAVDLSALNLLPVIGLFAFLIANSMGMGLVPTLMSGELFSSSVKGKALCFLYMWFSFLISTVTKLFQVLDNNVGLYAPFLLFAGASLASSIMTMYVVPETKGKTLEEIQQDLKGNKKKINDA